MKRKFFSQGGLRFSCTECGQCCSHPDGYVSLSENEASSIANFLDMAEEEFLQSAVNFDDDRLLRLNSAENGDCIFLRNNRCTIYPVRPSQCRTFPFWPENLKSAYRWKITAQSCPGINQGTLHTFEEIKRRMNSADNGD